MPPPYQNLTTEERIFVADFEKSFSNSEDLDDLINLLETILPQTDTIKQSVLVWLLVASETEQKLNRLSQERSPSFWQILSQMPAFAWNTPISGIDGNLYTVFGSLFSAEKNKKILDQLAEKDPLPLLAFFEKISWSVWTHFQNNKKHTAIHLFIRSYTLLPSLAKKAPVALLSCLRKIPIFAWAQEAGENDERFATALYYLFANGESISALHDLSQCQPDELLDFFLQIPIMTWAQQSKTAQGECRGNPLCFLLSAKLNPQTLKNLAMHNPSKFLFFLNRLPSAAWEQRILPDGPTALHELLLRETNIKTLEILAEKEPIELLKFLKANGGAWMKATIVHDRFEVRPIDLLYSIKCSTVLTLLSRAPSTLFQEFGNRVNPNPTSSSAGNTQSFLLGKRKTPQEKEEEKTNYGKYFK